MTEQPATTADRLVAAGLLASGVACLVASVAIEARIPAGFDGGEIAGQPGWETALTGVVLAALAAVMLLRAPQSRRFAWALGWFGLFWGTDGVAESYVRLALAENENLPGTTFAAWYLLRFTALLPATVAVLVLLFPTGRFVPGWWGRAGMACLAVLAVNGAVFVVTPAEGPFLTGLPPGVDPDPTTIAGLPPGLTSVTLALSLVSFVIPACTVVVRYRAAAGLERDRMRWLLWATVAIVLCLALVTVVETGALEGPLQFLVVNLAPAAMTIGVVAPRLVPIDVLLGRTAVYGGLSLIVVGLDLAALAGLTALLGDTLEQRDAVLLVLLLSAAVYSPLRAALWSAVRRLVLGERGARYDVVAGLASSLETADEGPEQLAAVARAVATAFGIPFAAVEVDRGGGERLVASYGERPAEVRTLPITYRDAPVGRLLLPARGLRSRLSGRDERLLGDLVRQAATAARAGRLADELQDSRERLVVAREEERRRIRRDLHDGLGPALSGVVFKLESATLLVEKDPAAAKEQIAATSAHLQEVVADVRRLVHDLRPPALDDRGLAGALAQQAERLGAGGPLVVTVEADGVGALPAAVEVAAFRIAVEAMTNVARHAGAARGTVRLRVEDRELLVEVADDGVGIPADAEAGIGLVSLRERAAELGGRSEVTCPAGGGTLVRAWLPLTRGGTDD